MIRILLVSAVFCSILVSSSCKKGKDDPAVSFLSRKARITGNWKLESGFMEFKSDSIGVISTYHFQLKPTSLVLTETSKGSTSFIEVEYSLGVDILKNGKMDIREHVHGVDNIFSGRWSFNSGAGEAKKKTDIHF